MLNKIIIGPIEKIDLLNLNIRNVICRVDTGAYLSTISASSVIIKPNGLEVVFFEPNSIYYTGQKLIFHKYDYIKIKSSNGLVERRYRIKLNIKLYDHKLKAWFTLTDRSKMKYSILIGRNVLKHRFLVDVGNLKLENSLER